MSEKWHLLTMTLEAFHTKMYSDKGFGLKQPKKIRRKKIMVAIDPKEVDEVID